MKLLPMNPAPPVTSMVISAAPSSVFQPRCKAPVVGDLGGVRRQPELVGLLVVVGEGRDAHEERRLGADCLEPMVDAWRDAEEDRVLVTDEELHETLVGGGVLAGVVERDLHHPVDAGEVVGLLLVVVPRLDDARVGRRAVDLAELLEDCVVAAEDLHQPAALVRDDVESLDIDTVDAVLHCCHRSVLWYRDSSRELHQEMTLFSRNSPVIR